MANASQKHAKNIAGPWFCTDADSDDGDGCIACNVCYSGAPEFFAEDEDGNAYVQKQPETEEEIALCQEQLEQCPVDSIGSNG